ncbi:MAG: hypothetical protein ACREBE_19145, partial [bacterium]
MKVRITLALIVGALTTARAQVQHVDGIDKARERFLHALAAKDTAVFREALTEDATTWFKRDASAPVNTGLPAITRFYAGLFANVTASVQMLFAPTALDIADDAAIETGRWEMPAFKTNGTY